MTRPRRVLLKLSGEQFAGSREHGIDPVFVTALAKELADVVTATKAEVAIVVGGGNFMRGAAIASHGIERTTGDYMGMLATIINGMAMVDVLEQRGQPARLQTRLRTDSVAEPYIRRRAIRHMEKGRVVIVAGGTGNPYVTTDTAAVIAALELECDMVLKATKVDGVYDHDPHQHAGATKYTELKHAEVLQNDHMAVMDNAAISLAMDNKLPIVVFDLLTHGNIKRIVTGETVGTMIKSDV
ncbi:MAG TPA: UMP kinase [Candidatus Saccharimonadales bacterium]|nr:UMP kinase [Candidatus Saccharimonadales bacterium]